jgi:regulator of sirC expression with transglutaminase-like and TPR domain
MNSSKPPDSQPLASGLQANSYARCLCVAQRSFFLPPALTLAIFLTPGLTIAQRVNAAPVVQAAEALIQVPEDRIDFAKAKVQMDKLVDPAIDADATLRQLDAMAAAVRALIHANANAQTRMETLRLYLYEPVPWNDRRPYQYDFADPAGTKVYNKLLANYLRTKKGNCVSMPFLMIALGQKLGLEMTAAVSPNHVFVKFRDDAGTWHNLEATSGGGARRTSSYEADTPMRPETLANGIYMRPLGKRETVALMSEVLRDHYLHTAEERPDLAIALADMALKYNPRDVSALLQKGRAYFLMARKEFFSKYPRPMDIPKELRPRYTELTDNNRYWFERAEALGWRESSAEAEAKYLQGMRRVVIDRQMKGEK